MSKVLKEKLSEYSFAFIIILVLILGIFIGRYIYPKEVIIKVPEVKVVTLDGKKDIKTEVVYVEKKSGENTDVELNVAKQTINVKLNDKLFEITPEFIEEYKFDKGKLVFNQSSSFDLNVKVPEQKNGIGLGLLATNKSINGLVSIPLKKNELLIDIGFDYNDGKEYGLGYMFRF